MSKAQVRALLPRPVRHSPSFARRRCYGSSTAAPGTAPLRSRASASFASASGNVSTSVRTGYLGGEGAGTPRRRRGSGWRPSAAPARPRGARTGRTGCRSCGSPRRRRCRPGARAASAPARGRPTGAKIRSRRRAPRAARSSEPPAQTAPSSRANAWPSASPGRVKAKTRRPWCRATWATMCAAAPKP